MGQQWSSQAHPYNNISIIASFPGHSAQQDMFLVPHYIKWL